VSIALELRGRDRDLGGGLRVNRLLPAAARQSVGPFVFFDHFGPMTVNPDHSVDVRPHPHIGLATVTYLFEGAMMHRDSLGNVQRIEPGAINWMSAGAGIVHSERRPDDLKDRHYGLHGLQLWVALPRALEESPPTFEHTHEKDLPVFAHAGVEVHLLIGTLFGQRSPVRAAGETLYADLRFSAATELTLPSEVEEMAVYSLDTQLLVDGVTVHPGTLAVLSPQSATRVRAAAPGRVMLIGGAPLDGRRHIWWNFVSSASERISRAADDWEHQRFARIPGETEFTPLPERRFNPKEPG
jgi:redox-sensitive bicupin YhaK (pirin superfamily)